MMNFVVSGISSLKAFRISASCFGYPRAGGVVQNQDLRLFQEGPGDAEPLALSAGHVGAALLDIGIVLVRKFLDKAVGLGQLTGVFKLLVGGVGIAPS